MPLTNNVEPESCAIPFVRVRFLPPIRARQTAPKLPREGDEGRFGAVDASMFATMVLWRG